MALIQNRDANDSAIRTASNSVAAVIPKLCFDIVAIFLEFLRFLWEGESCSSAVSRDYSSSLRARTVVAALETSRYSALIIRLLDVSFIFIKEVRVQHQLKPR